MKKIGLFLFLGIGACNTLPNEARTAMVGMTAPDILACAGKPDKYLKISENDWIIQYEQNQDITPDRKIAYGSMVSVEFGSSGRCHSVIRLHKGYVVGVHFTGPSITYTGANGACVPLIKECVTRQDHTSIPDNYDIGKYLGETK